MIVCTLLYGCERAHPVSIAGQRAYEVSLANVGDRLAVAWHGGNDNHSAIYLRYTNSQGKIIGIPLRPSDQSRDAYEPDLQFINHEPLLTWYEKSRHDGSLTAMLARFSQQGELRWRHELSAMGRNGRNPVVRVINDEIAAAWIETATHEQPAVWSTRFNADGKVINPAQRVADASRDTWNLNAAVDNAGIFYVVYDARLSTRAKELQLLKINHDHAARYTLSADDNYDSSYPDLSLNGEHAALTWCCR